MIDATINRYCAIVSLLLLGLSGCEGQRSNFTGNLSAPPVVPQVEPVAVVLRPGESESLETTVIDTTTFEPVTWEEGVDSVRANGRYLSVGPRETCRPAVAGTCHRYTVSAASESDTRTHGEFYVSGEDTDGRFISATRPVSLFFARPAAAPPVVELAAGAGHSLALTADGNVWAWGTNQSGQLGDGTRRRRSQPVPILDRGNIVTIAAGGTHSLAVDSEGNVWAWGNNFRGTLGDGTTDDQLAPVRLAALSNIIAVAASKGMSYALRSDGQVFGWGVFTPLWVRVPDDGPIYTVDTLTPVPIPTSDGFLTGIRAIAAGGDELTGRNGFLALDEDNRVWHAYDASFLRGQDPVGMEVKEGLPDIREIAVGGVDSVTARLSSPQDETFYLALDGENRVWSWGENRRNQLGRETPDRRDDIPAIIPNLGNVSSIAAGGEFAMAAVVGDPVTGSPEGSVWIWGDNGVGQGGGLGFDGAIQEPTPIHPLSALLINNEFDGVRIIAAGASHAMAVSVGRHLNACTEPGTGRDLGSRVYAWGSNIDGRRGDGTGIDALGATPVLTLGDDDSCVSDIGHRLIVYKQGLGSGEVTSDTEGTDPTSGIDQSFFCRGIMCWQNVPAGTTVTLTAVPDAGSSSSDSQWQWDCSTLAGLMTVSVQVNGPTHCKIRFIRGESEEPQDPQDPPPELLASFTVVPNPAVVDASIVFDAAGSSGDIASYQWDFNDDGTFDASGESVVHSYPAAGSYLARLRVSDTEGNSSETTESVSVTEASTQTALLTVEVIISGGPGGTVRDSNGGILCGTNGADCTEEIELGAAVVLTPIPEPGTISIRWTGCDEDLGEEGCFIQSMDGPRTVTATFSDAPP